MITSVYAALLTSVNILLKSPFLEWTFDHDSKERIYASLGLMPFEPRVGSDYFELVQIHL
ncbi:MAG: hypothetical protein HY537_06755 [Deltaproteobacteria bacterium]|nr:hypothetical protein [Deltaproteobacteria bacterium]